MRRSLPPIMFGILVGMMITARTGSEARPQESVQPKGSELVLDEFEIAKDGDVVVLPVAFAGRRFLFALDTGAGTTAFDCSLRPLLGEPLFKAQRATPTGAQSLEVFGAPRISVGRLTLHSSSSVLTCDLARLRQATGIDIYGILGMDFLLKTVIRMNWDNGKLSFLQAAGPQAGDAFDLLFSDGVRKPSIVARIPDWGAETFLVDTGSVGVGVGCGEIRKEAFDELVKKGAIRGLKSKHFMSLEGEGVDRLGEIVAVTLGPFRHEHILVSEGLRNVLGLGYWSRFVVTFDFPNKTLYLKKGKHYDRPEHCDLSGLHLLRLNGKTVVQSLEKASPAAEADLRPNDQILRIGDQKIEQLRLHTFRRMLCTPGQRVELTIRRGDKELEVSLPLHPWGNP